jgi:hypothetical protein
MRERLLVFIVLEVEHSYILKKWNEVSVLLPLQYLHQRDPFLELFATFIDLLAHSKR